MSTGPWVRLLRPMPPRLIHLGGNRLGSRILDALQGQGEDVVSVSDLPGLFDALSNGPVDWLVSAGYRYKIPGHALDAVPNSCNVHTALLPWGKGANPNVWMLAHGEPAGVTIHRMVPEIDAGPVYATRRVPVSFTDRAIELYGRLEDAAVGLFAETWPKMRAGELTPIDQEPGGSRHFVRDMRTLGTIDLDAPTTWRQAVNTLRALTFPPHQTAVVGVDGRRYSLELTVHEIDG